MGTILRIRIKGCMRTRQSSYVRNRLRCSNKGGHLYQPLDRSILLEACNVYVTCSIRDDVILAQLVRALDC